MPVRSVLVPASAFRTRPNPYAFSAHSGRIASPRSVSPVAPDGDRPAGVYREKEIPNTSGPWRGVRPFAQSPGGAAPSDCSVTRCSRSLHVAHGIRAGPREYGRVFRPARQGQCYPAYGGPERQSPCPAPRTLGPTPRPAGRSRLASDRVTVQKERACRRTSPPVFTWRRCSPEHGPSKESAPRSQPSSASPGRAPSISRRW